MVIPLTIAYIYKAFFFVPCTILSYIATQLTLSTIMGSKYYQYTQYTERKEREIK